MGSALVKSFRPDGGRATTTTQRSRPQPVRRVSRPPLHPHRARQTNENLTISTTNFSAQTPPKRIKGVSKQVISYCGHASLSETPIGDQKNLYKFYCPLCMLHFKGTILVTDCCENYVCFECALQYLSGKGGLPKDLTVVPIKLPGSIRCPHCASHPFNLTLKKDKSKVRSYEDSPTTTMRLLQVKQREDGFCQDEVDAPGISIDVTPLPAWDTAAEEETEDNNQPDALSVGGGAADQANPRASGNEDDVDPSVQAAVECKEEEEGLNLLSQEDHVQVESTTGEIPVQSGADVEEEGDGEEVDQTDVHEAGEQGSTDLAGGEEEGEQEIPERTQSETEHALHNEENAIVEHADHEVSTPGRLLSTDSVKTPEGLAPLSVVMGDSPVRLAGLPSFDLSAANRMIASPTG